MHMERRIHRRRFTRVSGAAALGLFTGRGMAAAPAVAETTTRRYRACVIGSTRRGNYGHGLDVAFQRLPNVAVLAVADPDERGRSEAARRAGASRAYADWREMLRQERPDLVTVGPRWVVDRLEMVRAAAEVGAHVYMEKPMATSLQEADAILDVAARRGIRIVVAHQTRVAPVIDHLKRLVDDGLVGDLLELRTRGKEDHRAGGEDLAVLGTHCMYLMRLFAGEPAWCTARVTVDGRDATQADGREGTEPLGLLAGDSIHASYAFEGAVQGHFASQRIRRGKGGRFQIALLGSEGIAIVHIDPDPRVWYLPDPLWSPGKTGVAWRPLPEAPSNADPSGLTGAEASNKRIVEGLLRWIEGGPESPVSGGEARRTLEMVHAVYAAHLEGGRVKLPLAEREHPLKAVRWSRSR